MASQATAPTIQAAGRMMVKRMENGQG